jgi:hypothetical protein
MAATRAARARTTGRRGRTRFYIGVALLMIAIALAGFWPRFYGPVSTGAALDPRSSHALIYLHSTLFMGWLFMLLAQAFLARSGYIRVHLKVGPILATYGFAIAAVGTYAGLVLAARRTQFGFTLDQAASFAFVTTTDMLVFAGLLSAAVLWRRVPETHKRLMVLATWSLAIVGFNRLLFNNFPVLLEYRWLTMFLMPLPAILGIGYDLAAGRRPHTIWWVGVAVFLLWANRRFVSQFEAWLPIGRELIRPFI